MDIIGIDLGTTNSAVGVVESGFPILLADREGARITPSAVSYDVDGNPIVGSLAVRRRGAGAEVITSVKRYMGRRYHEVENEDYCVDLSKAVDGGVLAAGKTPQQVSAEILKILRKLQKCSSVEV